MDLFLICEYSKQIIYMWAWRGCVKNLEEIVSLPLAVLGSRAFCMWSLISESESESESEFFLLPGMFAHTGNCLGVIIYLQYIMLCCVNDFLNSCVVDQLELCTFWKCTDFWLCSGLMLWSDDTVTHTHTHKHTHTHQSWHICSHANMCANCINSQTIKCIP